jgi:uncharacterized protein involved in exopolysaccharide biosynthesis
MRAETYTPQDVWRVLVQRKRTVLLVLCVTTILTVLGTYMMSPTYEASAKVIVKRAGEAIVLSSSGGGAVPAVGGTEEINTEVEIIRSRPVLEGALQMLQSQGAGAGKLSFLAVARGKILGVLNETLCILGLRSRLSEQDAALAKLEKKVFVKPQVESGVIRIVARDEDPEMTARIANAVTEEYIEYHSRVYQSSGAAQFFQERVEEGRTHLGQLEDSLRQFKEKQGLASIEEQVKNLVDKLTSYDTALTDVQKRIFSEEARIRMMREQMVLHPEVPIPTLDVSNMPPISQLQTKLLDLEHQRNLLLAKFTPDYGEVKTLDAQIEMTRESLRNEVLRMIDLREATLNSLHAERRALEATIASVRDRIRHLPRDEMVIDRLTRAVDDARNIHSLLLQRQAEASISESTDKRVVNLRIISRAYPPMKSVSPNRLLNVVLAPVLGLVVGVAAAFLQEFFAPSLKT